MLRKRWASIVLLALVLSVAACGGDDDAAPTTNAGAAATTVAAPATTAASSPTTTAAASATTTAAASATTAATENGGSSGSGVAANMAVVTVGDKTYEFDVEKSLVGKCDPDFFGAFWMIAGAADGSSGSLEMLIIPEGNTLQDETSRIRVNAKDADNRDWRADEDGGQGTPEGVSRVVSATFDGNTVSGTAEFVDIYTGDDATATGTFEAACP